MTFFGWFVQYVLKLAVLALCAGLGIKVGKKLAANKEEKAAESAEK